MPPIGDRPFLTAKDFAALTVKNAQSDRSRRPFETCRGDDCGRHIRHLNLDFLQCCRSAIWRCTNILDSERVRRGGDDARQFVGPPQFGKGSRLARRCLVAIGNENGIHRQPRHGVNVLAATEWRATANATRPQSRAILSELASSSRLRCFSLYAASPKSRTSASVSVSKRSILARRWGNQDNIGDSLGIRPTASYVSCMHLQRMLSGQFPRQSTNGKQSTGALLHAARRDRSRAEGSEETAAWIHQTLRDTRRELSPKRGRQTAETIARRSRRGKLVLFPAFGNRAGLRGFFGSDLSPAKTRTQ